MRARPKNRRRQVHNLSDTIYTCGGSRFRTGLSPSAAHGGCYRDRGATLPLRQGPHPQLASGLMLAASFGLVYEGVAYGLWRTLVGVVLALGFIVLTRKLLQLRKQRPVGFTEMDNIDARRCLS